LRAFPHKESEIPYSSPVAGRSLRRLTLVLLGLMAQGCHSTQVRTTPTQIAEMQSEGKAVVRLRDGSSVAVRRLIVVSDTLLGTRAESDSSRVAIPLSAVAGVESQDLDPLRTVGLVAGIALAAFVALLLAAQATLTP
jgi:hypothetical protein